MPRLTKDLLIQSLSVTKATVKVFKFGSTDFVKVPPVMALQFARTGEFEGGGTARRCRYIRPLTPPDLRNEPDFRPNDAFMGQTFVTYPQLGTALRHR